MQSTKTNEIEFSICVAFEISRMQAFQIFFITIFYTQRKGLRTRKTLLHLHIYKYNIYIRSLEHILCSFE